VTRIAVVGSANMDHIARVKRLPLPGETLLSSGYLQTPGGKGANQAVAAARAGADVMLIARMGDDAYGVQMIETLGAFGVETQRVGLTDGIPTGIANITVAQEGENTIVVVPGANSALDPADVEAAREDIAAADLLLLQLEIPHETVAHAMRVAHDSGTGIVLNTAPAPTEEVSFTREAGVLVANREELARLSGLGSPFDPASGARMLLGGKTWAVVVTLGNEGCVVVTQDHEVHVPAFPADAVDATGAGDAFVGNLAYRLSSGADLVEAARFASAAAAWCVGRLGAQVAMPSLEQTLTILQGEAP
jgi:ribokinase